MCIMFNELFRMISRENIEFKNEVDELINHEKLVAKFETIKTMCFKNAHRQFTPPKKLTKRIKFSPDKNIESCKLKNSNYIDLNQINTKAEIAYMRSKKLQQFNKPEINFQSSNSQYSKVNNLNAKNRIQSILIKMRCMKMRQTS